MLKYFNLFIFSEYFALYDYNVVCVDWSMLAMDLPYFTARMRCKEIGNYVGEMIETMTENTPQSNDDVHVLGFSMGAHIAGYAGKRLEGKVQRITGNHIKFVKMQCRLLFERV